MATNEYYFLDRWFIPHPVEAIWPYIVDMPAYPTWWGMVYDQAQPINDLPPDQVGARVNIQAHGRLPYKTRFISEVTHVEPPHKLGLNADGDLTGRGLWTLKEAGGGTDISFEWVVRADKPILRLFSPIFKPIFAWNHGWTMQQGEAALKQLLDQTKK
jgi:hypothetical protein